MEKAVKSLLAVRGAYLRPAGYPGWPKLGPMSRQERVALFFQAFSTFLTCPRAVEELQRGLKSVLAFHGSHLRPAGISQNHEKKLGEINKIALGRSRGLS